VSATSGPFAVPRWRRRERVAQPAGSQAGAALLGQPLFHLIVHVRRYRALYALGAAWVVVLGVLQPLDRTSSSARAPRLAAAAPQAAAAPPPVAPAAAAAATPAADSGAALAASGPAGPATPAATDSGSAPPYTPGSDAAPPSNADQPPPPPPPPPSQGPKCAPDANLPVPVVATAVGGLQQAQQGASSATGQPPPADAAGTVATTAGCSPGGSGAAGAAAPRAGAAPAPSSATSPWARLGLLPLW